jgi:capsular polysaccharide biosynthesis protein
LPGRGNVLRHRGRDLPARGNDLRDRGSDLRDPGNDLRDRGNDLPERGSDLRDPGNDLRERGSDLPERLSGGNDFEADDEPPSAFVASFVSLGFITAALRRSARLWCVTAAVGLLLGIGVYTTHPSAYQASTTILLVPDPGEQPGDSILTDVALAQSRAVAGRVVEKLGLNESAGGFAGSYTVTNTTDRVLVITASAPSASEAVTRATAVATEFLPFRAQQARAQEQILLSALQQQITQAQQHIKSLGIAIKRLSAQPFSPTKDANLNNLRGALSQARKQLPTLEQTVSANQASARLSMTQFVQGSRVLDPAVPLHYSHYKRPIEYAAIGLLVGLVLGMGIVIVRAIVSDRLRRRDDVAYALGAPVKLSVGRVRLNRWLPGRHGLVAAQRADIGRIVAHLGNEAQPNGQIPRTLAVVAVDNEQVAALSLASLALSRAQEGWRVVLADLASGAPAARLLGTKEPGMLAVTVNDAHLLVSVSDPHDITPSGPLPLRTSPQTPTGPAREFATTCASTDFLFTLVTLDPAVGGDHLATWADDAVVIVTAGQSSATRIHAVGEMVRLAGIHLDSAVLVGADKTDESLGMVVTPSDPP